MKAYKLIALLQRVEKLKAGDKRVLINGFPCKVDYRIIADDLFEDTVSAMKELIAMHEQVKNCSIPAVGQSLAGSCKRCGVEMSDNRELCYECFYD